MVFQARSLTTIGAVGVVRQILPSMARGGCYLVWFAGGGRAERVLVLGLSIRPDPPTTLQCVLTALTCAWPPLTAKSLGTSLNVSGDNIGWNRAVVVTASLAVISPRPWWLCGPIWPGCRPSCRRLGPNMGQARTQPSSHHSKRNAPAIFGSGRPIPVEVFPRASWK